MSSANKSSLLRARRKRQLRNSIPAALLDRSSPRHRPLLFEHLESRRVLAGDVSSLAAPLPAQFSEAALQERVEQLALPLSFEINRGQADSRVDFLSRGQGYQLFLTPNEAVLTLESADDSQDPESAASDVLRLQILGGQSDAQVFGIEELRGRSNYFLGNDHQEWITDVPHYAKVRYDDVYEGVDLVYYGTKEGQLEYDFVVEPGVDPSAIRLNFDGADELEVDAQGELVLSMPGGEVRQAKPFLYQEAGGTREVISGVYVIDDEGHVGFDVGSYDASQTLVIDPVLVYSTFIGGTLADSVNDIAVDGAGNVYITGTTRSADFDVLPKDPTDPTSKPLQGPHLLPGVPCAFVTKLNSTGTELVYSTFLGGRSHFPPHEFCGSTGGAGIAVDSAGSAYVTGAIESIDFPVVNGFQSIFGGKPNKLDGGGTEIPLGSDAFVAKLNPSGSKLLYSTYLGGMEEDAGRSIAVDIRHNAHVTGFTCSTRSSFAFPADGGFPVAGNSLKTNQSAFCDAFVTTIDTNKSGNASLVYSTYLGGGDEDVGNDIAVDGNGLVYVTGSTASDNVPPPPIIEPFPTTASAYQNKNNSVCVDSGMASTCLGRYDAFLVKIDPILPGPLSSLQYATFFGGSRNDYGFGVAVDVFGKAYVTGLTNSNVSEDFPRKNAYQPDLGGGTCFGSPCADAFVAVLDTNESGTSSLFYSTHLGGTGYDFGTDIAVDAHGKAYVTGSTASVDDPKTHAVKEGFPLVPMDMPLQGFGGSPTVCSLPLGADCEILVGDAFVAKLEPSLPGDDSLVYSTYLGGSLGETGNGIAVDGCGAAYVAGWTRSGDFPHAPSLLTDPFQGHNEFGPHDGFVAKISGSCMAVRGVPVQATRGLSFSGPVATFIHADPTLKIDNFTAVINWGDDPNFSSNGVITQPGGPGTPFQVSGSHTYTKGGPFLITVKVIDQVNNVLAKATNVTRLVGNQAEATIAVDPTNTQRVFAAAVDETGPPKGNGSAGLGISTAFSTDGGLTWSSRVIADGSNGLPTACCDPWARFDQFGNLFLAYLSRDKNNSMDTIVVLLSKDGGQSFDSPVFEFAVQGGEVDKPHLVTGPGNKPGVGSVWVKFTDAVDPALIFTAASSVTGLGAVSTFDVQVVPYPPAPVPPAQPEFVSVIGDMALGPSGEVLVSFLAGNDQGQNIYVSRDPDGLGPAGFSQPTEVTATNVPPRLRIPPHNHPKRGIHPDPNLAWDRSSGEYHGRVYLVYTDADPNDSGDTNILMRYSDTNGASWVPAVQVNDDTGKQSQFFPDIAVDPATGDLAVSWHDARNDPSNIKTEYFAAASVDGGLSFSPNVAISSGPSDAINGTVSDAELRQMGSEFAYGDYTALSFINRILTPAWADNSPELGWNRDLPQFDVATAAVGVACAETAPIIVAAQHVDGFKDQEFTGLVATFPDPFGVPSDFKATIDWGDGQSSDGTLLDDGLGGFDVIGTHTYAQTGSFPVTVTVTGLCNGTTTDTSTADVVAKLAAVGTNISVLAGALFTLSVGSFTDAAPTGNLSDYSVDIHWGDNNSNIGSVVQTGPGQFDVIGTYSYASPGLYTISFMVQNVSGPSATATSTANVVTEFILVQDEPVLKAFESIPTGVLNVATFSVQGQVGAPNDYVATVDWDDPMFPGPVLATIGIVGNTIQVFGGHTYGAGGTYQPKVTLTKNTGSSAIATSTIDVGTDVSNQVMSDVSGLVFDSQNQVFVGDITVTNISSQIIPGPIIQIVLMGLPAGVTLTNAAGLTAPGDPYLQQLANALPPGDALVFPVQFDAPPFGYTVTTFSDPPSDWFTSSGFGAPASAASDDGLQLVKTPLSFEPNLGQVEQHIEFVSRGQGYSVSLVDGRAQLTLQRPSVAAVGDGGDPQAAVPVVLNIVPVGASPATPGVGVDPLPGKANYLIGSDPNEWYTEIPTYARVEYEDLYPGINLVYYGNQQRLEYDFVVSPGADPASITLALEGADAITLDADGNLVLQTAGGDVVQPAPVLYQEIDGARHPIDGGYLLESNGQVAFEVGLYDASQPLVIDPVLKYASYLGGIGGDDGRSIAVDAAGNTYLTGITDSIDFFVTPNAGQPELQGTDAFVTKLDASGLPVYSTYFGGEASDFGFGIAVDTAGNAYVVGETRSSDFPTVAALQPAAGGPLLPAFFGDAFVAKLDSTGSSLVYSTFLGGTSADIANAIAIDAAGAAHVTGLTNSLDFPTANAIQPQRGFDPGSTSVGYDAFVTKIKPDGSGLDYSTYLGGGENDFGSDVAVDAAGNTYVTGGTASVDLPLANPLQANLQGLRDSFVTKLNSDGSALLYSTYLGGGGEDFGLGIDVDSAGNAFLTGHTESVDFPVNNAFQSALQGVSDAFLTKLDALGTNLVYSSYFGGGMEDEGRGIALDANGNVLIAGRTSSTDLPIVNAVQTPYRGGISEGFLVSFDPSGSALSYSTYLGGSGEDELNDIAVDASGSAYVVGSTESFDLRTVNAAQPYFASVCQSAFGCPGFGGIPDTTWTGVADIFDTLVAKIAPQGSATPRLFGKSLVAVEGAEFNGLVGQFTDTDSDLPSDYVATVDWGDGQTSVGTITTDGIGNFKVFGTHTYANHGIYDVLVTLEDRDGTIVTPNSTAADTTDAGFVDYQVVVDTSALSGTAGFLSLQFNPGVTSGAQSADASVTNFAALGGTIQPGTTLEGAVAGTLPGGVQMSNSSQLNWFTQALTYGTELSFDVRLSGEAIADPAFNLVGTNFGSSFAVQLLADDGLTPQLSTDASGAVLRVDIEPDGATQATAFATSIGSGDPVATTSAFNSATVLDAPLTGEKVPFIATEGIEFTGIVAAFTDANSFSQADEFSAVIAWGDGTPTSAGTIASDGAGGYTVTGTHTYGDVGQYPLGVTISSSGGAEIVLPALPPTSDFQTALPTSFTGNAVSMASGDFNQDGNRDLVIPDLSVFGNEVIVLLGKGDGRFEDPTTLTAGLAPHDVIVGDFNNDGRQDVAVSSEADENASVLLGNGDGSFQTAIATPAVGEPVFDIETHDFNADGNLDLILGLGCKLFCGNRVPWLPGNGDGTFGAPVYLNADFGVHHIELGDVDGNGTLDPVVFNSFTGGGDTVSVLLSNGDGTFEGAITSSVPTSVLGGGSVGDLDADGHADLVLGGTGSIHVLLGIGDGTFAAAVEYPVLGEDNDSRIVDFDDDGKQDVVVRSGNSVDPDGLSVLVGNGDGTLQAAVSYPGVLAEPVFHLVDEFTGDGNLDVAAIDSHGISVVSGNGDGTVVAPAVFSVLPNVFPKPSNSYVVAADLNVDGKADLVLQGYIRLGNGDGTFAPAVKHGGRIPTTVTIGDLNGDTIPDLVGTVGGSSNPAADVSVLLGNGDGSFGPHADYPIPQAPSTIAEPFLQQVAVGDVNNDGKPDMVVAASRSSNVLLGNGDGTFQPPSFFFAEADNADVSSVALADFDGDGNQDIAGILSVLFVNDAIVFLGNGDGTFQGGTRFPVGDDPQSLVTADFNADGKADIAVANAGGSTSGPSISLLTGVGDGTFLPAVNHPFDGPISSLNVVDLDHNGSLDLAAAGGLATTDVFNKPRGISILFNHCDGTFEPPQSYHSGSIEALGLTTADVSGDGRTDLVSVFGDSLSVGGKENTLSVINNSQTDTGATVGNAPLAATGTGIHPVVNVPFTAIVASLNDTNVTGDASDYSATIEWGDGSTSTGTLVSAGNGVFDVIGSHTYAQTGPFTISTTIRDDDCGTTSATVTALVSTVDQPIVASPVTFSVMEDESFTTVVATFTDADPNGSASDFNATIDWGDGNSSSGRIAADGNGGFQVEGTHSYAQEGVYSVDVAIADIGGSSASVTSTAQITPAANERPLAADDTANTNEDTPVNLVVLANDSDEDGDPLTVTLISGPSDGAAIVEADGSITYSPDPDFNGTDTLAYRANDGTADSNTALVTIEVAPVDDAPVAIDDTFSVDEDNVLVLDAANGVLANDLEVDGDPLSVMLVDHPMDGTLTLAADGSLTYLPETDFNGTDSFTYKTSDTATDSNIANVTIQVIPVNDAPVASGEIYSGAEDTSLTIDAETGVLANDSDLEGDALTVVGVSNAANGLLNLNIDGSFTYTPDVDFNGTDSFAYAVFDGTGSSQTVVATIQVGAVNDNPVAGPDTYFVDEDQTLVVSRPGVLTNDFDVDGSLLTVHLLDPPLDGALQLFGNGSFLYTPDPNFHGVDAFRYKANDGTSDSEPAEVTIVVRPVLDPPMAIEDSAVTQVDEPVTIQVLANDLGVDAPLDPATVGIVLAPRGGATSVDATSGSIVYAPRLGFFGLDSFLYQVCDGNGLCAVARVTVTVNRAPIAGDDSAVTDEDLPVTISVGANDSDPDGDPLTVDSVTQAAHGIVQIAAADTLVYEPHGDFFGSDGFSYTVSDGNGGSATATVSVTVLGVDDSPVAAGDAYLLIANTSLNAPSEFGVLANDIDADGDSLTAALIRGPDNGTLAFNPDGSFAYAPDAGFEGDDGFAYQASDGTNNSNVAEVAIAVVALDDLGVAFADELQNPFVQLLSPPVSDAGGPYTVAEGGLVQLDASQTTDSDESSATLVYEWDLDGDSIFGETGTDALHGDETGVSPNFSAAAFDGPNFVLVALQVTDAGGLTDEDVATIRIVNVPPTLLLDAVAMIDENGTASLTGSIVDAGTLDTFTLDVDWGDPLSPDNVEQYTFGASAAGSQSFTLTHQYLDENPSGTPQDSYTISATVTDDDTGSGSASQTLLVKNVPPTLLLDPVPMIDKNGTASLSGTIVDAGTLDTFVLDVDWGDPLSPNNVEQYTFGASAAGSQTFTLTHQYLDENPSGTPQDSYTISATVTDDDTGSDSDTETVLVTNVAPVIVDLTNSSPGCGCESLDHKVTISGSFSAPDTLGAHTALVNWDDGTAPESILVDQLNDTFAGSHFYATGGIFEISVTVFDENGGSDPATTTAFVTGVRLTKEGALQIVGTPGKDYINIKRTESDGTDGGSDGDSDSGPDLIKIKAEFDGGSDAACDCESDGVTDHGSDGGTDHFSAGGSDGSDGGSDGSEGGSDGSDGGSDFVFEAPDVTSIEIYLCDGDDHAKISHKIDVAAMIHGGGGKDKLTGGSGHDQIFGDDGNDDLKGGAGDDLLDGGDGNDKLKGGSGSDILMGAAGDDDLKGGGGSDGDYDGGSDGGTDADADVLVGGDGNDKLQGGNDRDVLIGGRDKDDLRGGKGDDILIAGFTTYDANVVSLMDLRTEWTSLDDYTGRVNHLLSGNGATGVQLLPPVTVFDDPDDIEDRVKGDKGQDWFLADTHDDHIAGKKGNEVLTDIDPPPPHAGSAPGAELGPFDEFFASAPEKFGVLPARSATVKWISPTDVPRTAKESPGVPTEQLLIDRHRSNRPVAPNLGCGSALGIEPDEALDWLFDELAVDVWQARHAT